MLESTLRAAAVVCTSIVLLSYALFAIGETRSVANQTADEVAGREVAREASPPPYREAARERAHPWTREMVDDANDVLLAPFASVTDRRDPAWERRTLPTIIGVIVYGFMLGFLARFARGRPGSAPPPPPTPAPEP